MSGRLPNFFIVGAHKCGTTSLLASLSTHKNIFVPTVKEPHFLCNASVKDSIRGVVNSISDYKRLFNEAEEPHRLVGEASVFYLYRYEESIANILKYIGQEVKIVICVRDPISRAYSAYLDVSTKNHLETESFLEALKLEESRKLLKHIPPSMHYGSVGAYSEMIKAYQDTFKNVHLIRFEDLVADSEQSMKELLEFLDVDYESSVVLRKDNVGGGVWKSNILGALVKMESSRKVRGYIKRLAPKQYNSIKSRTKNVGMTSATEIDSHSRQFLEDYYSNEFIALNEIDLKYN